MKAITVRLSEEEMKRLQQIKESGFSTLGEVIKCAALSLVDSANGKPQPAR